MIRYMRESIYGGVSECKSPADKVGYGRCHHIAGESNPPQMQYNSKDKCNYVDLGEKRDNNEKSKEKEENIKNIVYKINNQLKDEDIDKILRKIS